MNRCGETFRICVTVFQSKSLPGDLLLRLLSLVQRKKLWRRQPEFVFKFAGSPFVVDGERDFAGLLRCDQPAEDSASLCGFGKAQVFVGGFGAKANLSLLDGLDVIPGSA